MAVVGNFYFFIFLRLMWKFLGLESERGVSVCWPNNKIIDYKKVLNYESIVTKPLRVSASENACES